MCCPVVPALRCEILIGYPQADDFDCPCSTCHVYIHVLTLTAAMQHYVCEILRLQKCIGSYDIHSREIRKYVYHCQILCALHISHHSSGLCTSMARFNSSSIHFQSESRFSKNTNIVRFFCMTIYNLYQNNNFKTLFWIEWIKNKLLK